MTLEGDLVLVYIRGKPAFFARIEQISEDVKPGWFQVKLLVLQIPLVVVTWILREAYINGEEFTMGGHPVTLTRVVCPEHEEQGAPDLPEASSDAADGNADRAGGVSAGDPVKPAKGGEKVLSLVGRRKKGR
jgi:hypothetical protein